MLFPSHDPGTDQNRNGTITAITANILSGDFDITQARAQGTGQATGVATFRGDGEFLMKSLRLHKVCLITSRNTNEFARSRNHSDYVVRRRERDLRRHAHSEG